MKTISLFTNAVESLTINKLRTFLTVLGIVIGITSVITLINVGQAAQATIESSVSAFGSNLISIMPGKFQSSSGFSFDLSANFDFSNAVDLRNMEKDYVGGVATEHSKVMTIKAGNNNETLSVTGVFGDYFTVRNVAVSAGRIINDKDSDSLSKVAVLPCTINRLIDFSLTYNLTGKQSLSGFRVDMLMIQFIQWQIQQ